jgi:hypothetical protein
MPSRGTRKREWDKNGYRVEAAAFFSSAGRIRRGQPCFIYVALRHEIAQKRQMLPL